MEHKAPPIGLTPQHIWQAKCDKERFTEVKKAIIRYAQDEIKIPEGWVEEYNHLHTKNQRYDNSTK